MSEQLAKGDIMAAKKMYKAIKAVSVFIVLINGSLLYWFHVSVIAAFTSNQHLIQDAAKLVELVCVNTMLDSYKGMLKGISKAIRI